MKADKRRRLEAAGWRVGTVQEFLGLSDAEARLVEVHAALAVALRQRRTRAGMTQSALAKRLKSSQSRVAKMETGDPTVTLDLLVRALFLVGASPQQVARAITSRVA